MSAGHSAGRRDDLREVRSGVTEESLTGTVVTTALIARRA